MPSEPSNKRQPSVEEAPSSDMLGDEDKEDCCVDAEDFTSH